ncbi:DUF559 domain-containing protein [Pengzhenrongella sicca]|uniref:DUF559 domain-containing protein n=1 Tax=Pengzhenrongella sicca TaxID=2819238 RepID=A0A8A4Z837_9MICO|nr:DUF559 domain-containing protein [Pengzhenrongella sicca]QTE28022.1 DUF559 domain-containing protein [Pengzhenrongella sicca]
MTTFPRDWVPPVARRQSGLFTSEQACAAGMTAAQVRRRRTNGTWNLIVGAALAPATLAITAWTRAQGAALTWPRAVVCLGSAAAIYRLPVPADAAVHVSVQVHRRDRYNLRAHQLQLEPVDVTRSGIALITTRSRTLFDCLGRFAAADSDALLSWAVTRELITAEELDRAIAERPKWWGNVRRRQAAQDARAGALGPAERRLHAILRAAGLTGWHGDRQVWDQDGLIGRADVLFEAERLVIEIDGFAYHGRARFQEDRTRQNRLVNAGHTVLRFTWADVTDRPEAVLREIRRALARLGRK